jgi:PAS domain S-box-containing protein
MSTLDQFSKKILLVDDEQEILDGIRRQLRGQFELDTALGGRDGLDFIALSGPYAVVISDLQMSEMDGHEFLRNVRAISPLTVCVMLTGFGDMDVAVRAVNEGRIFRFLSKPCEKHTLVEAITDGLEQYRQLATTTSYTYSADIIDEQVVWTHRSQGCMAVTGYSQKEIVANNLLWMSMIEPQDKSIAIAAVKRILAGDENGPVEFKIKKRDGSIRWVRDTMIPKRNSNTNTIKIEGLVEDITEIKNIEKELIQTNQTLKEHDKMKNQFVTTVSHELRTPLCIFKNIISNAMAGTHGKLNKKLYQSLKMADDSIDRLARIINDFLDISKIEAGALKLDPTKFSINKLAREIVNPMTELATAKEITLKINTCKNDIIVNADRDRIAQVFTNLVGNAIKFVLVNGNINVSITDENDFVKVTVDDDGPGLSKDEIEKVFDRFVQVNKPRETQEHGTGLGLAITKELIEMHKGRLWVDSLPGHGCAFSFTLPKAATQTKNAKKELTNASS